MGVIVNVTSQSRGDLSHVAGRNSVDITFTADWDFTSVEVHKVTDAAADITQGTLVETIPLAGVAGTAYTITVDDAELTGAGAVEGSNLAKVFVIAPLQAAMTIDTSDLLVAGGLT